MAPEAAVRFLEVLETDTALQQEVGAVVAATAERLEAVVTVARGHGHDFTVDELKAAVEARTPAGGEELTEAEIQGVVGGAFYIDIKRGRDRRTYY